MNLKLYLQHTSLTSTCCSSDVVHYRLGLHDTLEHSTHTTSMLWASISNSCLVGVDPRHMNLAVIQLKPLNHAVALRSHETKMMIQIWFWGNHILMHTQLLRTRNRSSWYSVSNFSAIVLEFLSSSYRPNCAIAMQAEQSWKWLQGLACLLALGEEFLSLESITSCNQSFPAVVVNFIGTKVVLSLKPVFNFFSSFFQD